MQQKVISVAIAGALLLGAAGAAQANFKGFSNNEITNFSFQGVGGATYALVPPAIYESDNGVSWSGLQAGNTVTSPPQPTPPPALTPGGHRCGPAGCSTGPEPYSQIPNPPPYIGFDWARANSEISDGRIGSTGAARVVAEVVAAPGTTAFASADGSNALNGVINVTQGGVFQFAFDAEGFLEVWTPVEGGKAFSGVGADISFQIEISRASDQEVVFVWAPDGDCGLMGCAPGKMVSGGMGGTEISDPYDLNFALGSIGSVVNATVRHNGSWLASLTLDQGLYNIAIEMENSAFGVQVPAPATLALLGAGLAGIGMSRRRSKKA